MAPLELFSIGRHRPEEAVVPTDGGEGQHYCRGEGDVVVVGGEAMEGAVLLTMVLCDVVVVGGEAIGQL